MSSNYAIGVDLGGTKIGVALIEFFGDIAPKRGFNIIENVHLPTDVGGGVESIIKDIITAVKALKLSPAIKDVSLGVAAAGQVDLAGEVVLSAPNLYWKNVPLKFLLAQGLKMDIILLNDVRAATIGELCFGAGKGFEDVVCLFVGTGIGGGVICKGRMIKGCNNSAGELGHIVVGMDIKSKCSCGNRGCLEAIASGGAIGAAARELLISGKQEEGQILLAEVGNSIERISTKDVFSAAKKGDIMSQKLLDRALEALIAGGVTIVNSLNPKKLILGGGVMHAQPEWLPKIKSAILERALKSATDPLNISFGDLGKDAGIIGAAAAAKGVYNDY